MFKKLIQKLTVRNTLYYPGCLTKYTQPEIQENYEKILKKCDVDYIMLKELELCCGSPALKAGYKKDFNKIKKKNLKLFEEYGIARVISNCPSCYNIFKNEYGLESEHFSTFILRNIKKFNDKQFDEEISYHDPCHLGRSSNIYKEPREALEKMGFKIVELRGNHNLSLCCGGGGSLKSNFPEVSNKVAKVRLSDVKTKRLITPCPMCYANLKDNAPKGVKVIEFSEVFV